MLQWLQRNGRRFCITLAGRVIFKRFDTIRTRRVNVSLYLIFPADFSRGQYDVTPTSREYYSWRQQLHCNAFVEDWMMLLAAYTSLTMLFNGPDNPQNCPALGECWPPSNTWLLGPTRVNPSNGISIGSAIFCAVHPYNQHTNTHTYKQTTLYMRHL